MATLPHPSSSRGPLKPRLVRFDGNFRFDTGLAPDVTVAVRLDRSNERPLDYYILPSIDMNTSRIRMAEDNALFAGCLPIRISRLSLFDGSPNVISFREAA
jgi:hypothetical protein